MWPTINFDVAKRNQRTRAKSNRESVLKHFLLGAAI